jgi:hypothetical protein
MHDQSLVWLAKGVSGRQDHRIPARDATYVRRHVAAWRVCCCSGGGWTPRRFPEAPCLLVAYMIALVRRPPRKAKQGVERRVRRRRTVAFSMIKEASPRVCLLHDLECDTHGSWMLRFYKWDALVFLREVRRVWTSCIIFLVFVDWDAGVNQTPRWKCSPSLLLLPDTTISL